MPGAPLGLVYLRHLQMLGGVPGESGGLALAEYPLLQMVSFLSAFYIFIHVLYTCPSPAYREQWGNVTWTGTTGISGWVESTVMGPMDLAHDMYAAVRICQIHEHPTEGRDSNASKDCH